MSDATTVDGRWPTRSRLLLENQYQRDYIRTAAWAYADALLALEELDPVVAARVRDRWADVEVPA